MKRFHVHLHVADLAENIRFYSTLFGTEPVVTQPDYAKWMLEDPRLNFALSTSASGHGIGHLGLQVETPAELAEISARSRNAELGGRDERQARCCYAQSNKHWLTDPQGVTWETFETFDQFDGLGERRLPETANRPACCA